MNDPKKLFVISAISRKDIAESLNNALESLGVSAGCESLDEPLTDEQLDRAYFAPDDPRLTDKVCQKIAALLYDADSQLGVLDEITSDTFNEFVANMPKKMFKRPAK